jgi:hypothetical protein
MIKLIVGAILVLQPGASIPGSLGYLSRRASSVWKVVSVIAELVGYFLIGSYSVPAAVLLFAGTLLAGIRFHGVLSSAHDVVWNLRHGEEPWPGDVLKLASYPVLFYVTGVVKEGGLQGPEIKKLVEKAFQEHRETMKV